MCYTTNLSFCFPCFRLFYFCIFPILYFIHYNFIVILILFFLHPIYNFNLIHYSPPGVGKTHLAVGLGIKACMLKYRVVFISIQKLIEDLVLAVKDGSITDKLLAYSRLHLLIIDELGYMPIAKEQANLLFQLISIRYEKGAIVLTSNYNFEDWGRFFQDNVVASAIIDRLVHHAKIFYINGESYRLKNKLKKTN